jgi:hypothetical protein
MEGVAMKATKSWAGALASALLCVSSASAQYHPATGQYYSPVRGVPVGQAPDACGPGYYLTLPNGQIVGPNYDLRPCFPPFNGVLPKLTRVYGQDGRMSFVPAGVQGPPEAQYPYHPYARSPRDFFMFRENLEDQLSRQTRPSLLP